MNEQNETEEVRDLRGLFPAGTRLKVQLKAAKEYTNQDVSRFKVGKAYEVKNSPGRAFLINAIALNPMSAVPMGMGFLATETDFIPYTINLCELGKEFFF